VTKFFLGQLSGHVKGLIRKNTESIHFSSFFDVTLSFICGDQQFLLRYFIASTHS
jgi:hypothetical protein